MEKLFIVSIIVIGIIRMFSGFFSGDKIQSYIRNKGGKHVSTECENTFSNRNRYYLVKYYDKHDKKPNEIQAWGALCLTPPEGYIITIDKHSGEDCLNMQGANRLTRRSFTKRWKSYTANNT